MRLFTINLLSFVVSQIRIGLVLIEQTLGHFQHFGVARNVGRLLSIGADQMQSRVGCSTIGQVDVAVLVE